MIDNVRWGGGGASGERPLGDVLLQQVVVQVSAQRADGHRRHVTGAAVCVDKLAMKNSSRHMILYNILLTTVGGISKERPSAGDVFVPTILYSHGPIGL